MLLHLPRLLHHCRRALCAVVESRCHSGSNAHLLVSQPRALASLPTTAGTGCAAVSSEWPSQRGYPLGFAQKAVSSRHWATRACAKHLCGGCGGCGSDAVVTCACISMPMHTCKLIVGGRGGEGGREEGGEGGMSLWTWLSGPAPVCRAPKAYPNDFVDGMQLKRAPRGIHSKSAPPAISPPNCEERAGSKVQWVQTPLAS